MIPRMTTMKRPKGSDSKVADAVSPPSPPLPPTATMAAFTASTPYSPILPTETARRLLRSLPERWRCPTNAERSCHSAITNSPMLTAHSSTGPSGALASSRSAPVCDASSEVEPSANRTAR